MIFFFEAVKLKHILVNKKKLKQSRDFPFVFLSYKVSEKKINKMEVECTFQK